MTVNRRSLRTFDNRTGRNVFYRALLHPLTAPLAASLIARVAAAPSVAVYDPAGYFGDLAAAYDLASWKIAGVYAQRLEELGDAPNLLRGGHVPRPVTELAESKAALLLVADFDSARRLAQLGPYRPAASEVLSFDQLRLDADRLTVADSYLDPLNFVSDFLFFRDAEGLHTTVSTANYWHGHGAAQTRLWCRLFDETGAALATWEERLEPAVGAVLLDSRTVRARFGLGAFTGSLFVHVIGTARHDTLKYAVDIFDESGRVATATHDSNPWAADFYAGLPAARPGESVRIWVQNCYPTAIPTGGIACRIMGDADFTPIDTQIPPYGTSAIDMAALFPHARWPTQFEIRADKYFCRPRYEIAYGDGLRSMAHANVERTDLMPAPDLARATESTGKGFILTAPILPVADWSMVALPTPMATSQQALTLTLRAYGSDGTLLSETRLGRRARGEQVDIDVNALLPAGRTPDGGYGHLELGYDFAHQDLGGGAEADGWLHAIFRYTRRATGRPGSLTMAETSFGSHMFNVPATWRSEPNSYLGPPPGLSTRLFLRLTDRPGRVMCHLTYPTSGRWHPLSDTELILHSAAGREIARRRIAIPCSGSRLLDMSTLFNAAEHKEASGTGYVTIRDTTCRLFGYHLFLNDQGGFAMDHMFGF